MTLSKNISETAKELLWPTRCALCDEPGQVLCDKCRSTLRYVDLCKSCERCGASGGRLQCSECNSVILDAMELEKYPFDKFRSCVILNENARRLVSVYKDESEVRLAKEISNIMFRYFEPVWIKQNVKIAFIPPTQEAMLKRGFNHTKILANKLGELSGCEIINCFTTPKSSDQRKLGKKERILNMKKQLRVLPNANFERKNPIVIIDDVCTTGATMQCAASALKKSGVQTIYGLTFARVMN